jgi:hypothetical protein
VQRTRFAAVYEQDSIPTFYFRLCRSLLDSVGRAGFDTVGRKTADGCNHLLHC